MTLQPNTLKRSRWSRPRLEMLEDRCVPAVFGTVQGSAFIDGNSNGVFDSGEAGLPGVQITLVGTTPGATGNTTIDSTTTTQADGSFTFTNVPEGDYDLTSGFVPGLTNGSGATFSGVSINAAGDVVVHDFGYKSGISSQSFTLRQFLTNSTDDDLPFNSAGAGNAEGNHTPFLKTAIPPQTIATSVIENPVVDLAGFFTDADITNSQVTFNITDGTTPRTVTMTLFDTLAPRTVTNFFNYVTSGKYDNSVFHRLTSILTDGLGVLQGGALSYANAAGTNLNTIPIGDKILNEFSASRSNVAGTIAMAQTSGNINSATSQFFFNMVSNAGTLDAQKFAVFGEVMNAQSQNALNAMNSVTTVNVDGGAFATAHPTVKPDDFPLHNYTGNSSTFAGDAAAANYITINSITVDRRDETLTYSLVGANGGADAAIANVSLVNNFLTIDPVVSGTTSVTVMATDRFGSTHTTTFAVTVTGNHAPIASDGTLTALEDSTVPGTLTATDPDAGNTLTFTIVSHPAKGQLNLTSASAGTYTYNPGNDFQNLAAGETGTTTFTFKATDNVGAVSLIKTVTITVTGLNDAPVGTPGSLSTDQNTPANGTLAATDIDATDMISNFTILTQPEDGSVVAIDSAAGTYTFNPETEFRSLAEGQSTPVTFTFQATDEHGTNSVPATVVVTVTGLNDAPFAADGALAAEADAPTNGTLVGSDFDLGVGETFTFEVVDLPLKGSVSLNASNGQYTFDPGAAFANLVSAGDSEIVTFTYKVVDVHGAPSAVKTITVTVTKAPVVTSALITPDNATDVQVLTANPVVSNQGAAPITFTYQWRKNGNPIGGETSQSLNLGGLGVVVGDTFDVIVIANVTGATSDPFISPVVTIVTTSPFITLV